MAKTVTRTRTTSRTQKKTRLFDFPLEKQNLMYIGTGIGLVILGYIFMAQNSVDGFLPTVVAPLLLVAGYCVLIPYGILKRFDDYKTTDTNEVIIKSEDKTTETKTTTTTPSGNIRTK